MLELLKNADTGDAEIFQRRNPSEPIDNQRSNVLPESFIDQVIRLSKKSDNSDGNVEKDKCSGT